MPSRAAEVAVAASRPEPVARSLRALVADVISLTKPRLSLMVLFTCAGGAWLARTPMPLSFWLVTLVATAGTVGAANAFNCFIERRSDRFMVRTAGRPLPAERMEPTFALLFAIGLSLVSVPALFIGSGWLPGALGLLALLSYVLAYTPLKSRTHWAMLVGAVPGALPPLMGWVAATGRISAPGLSLFAILFVWQLPHFIAIALFRKDDYRNAGLTSLPLAHGDLVAWRCAVLYLLLLIPVSALPFVVGVASWVYLIPAMALGLMFLLSGLRGLWGERSLRDARKLFATSLLYLLLLFLALGADRALH